MLKVVLPTKEKIDIYYQQIGVITGNNYLKQKNIQKIRNNSPYVGE